MEIVKSEILKLSKSFVGEPLTDTVVAAYTHLLAVMTMDLFGRTRSKIDVLSETAGCGRCVNLSLVGPSDEMKPVLEALGYSRPE